MSCIVMSCHAFVEEVVSKKKKSGPRGVPRNFAGGHKRTRIDTGMALPQGQVASELDGSEPYPATPPLRTEGDGLIRVGPCPMSNQAPCYINWPWIRSTGALSSGGWADGRRLRATG